MLRRLPVLSEASALTVEQVLGWLRELYSAESSSWLGSIQPDLLLEYLVTSVFSGSDELADAALTGLAEHRANHALIVLARSFDHYPAPAAALLRRLLMRHADVLALAAVRLARNLDKAAFSQLLADILTDAWVTDEVLTALVADLRQIPVSLVAVTIAVNLRAGVGDIAAGHRHRAAETATVLGSLAYQMLQSEFHGAAVDAYSSTVTLYRALEEAEPGRYRPDFARALSNLGATLSNLGQERDAHPVKAEAVELYRAAEKAEPGRYRPELARALINLGTTLSNLDHLEEALTVTGEAVKLYRVLFETEPTAYQGRLADTLIQWSGILLDLGRLEEAEYARREADLYGRSGSAGETQTGQITDPDENAVTCYLRMVSHRPKLVNGQLRHGSSACRSACPPLRRRPCLASGPG